MAIIPNLSRNTWASRLQKDTWSDWCCPKMQQTWNSHRNSTNAQWNIWPTTILRWSISMVTLTHGAHRALPDYHSPKTKPTCMYMFARVVHTAHEFSHSPNPPDRKSSTLSADGWRNRQRTGKLIWSNWRPNTLIWKSKEKSVFSLYFSRFALSLDLQPQDTHVRQSRRKNAFSFAFRSLNRIFNPSDFRYSRSAKQKKKAFSFAFHSLNRIFAILCLNRLHFES